MIIKLYYGFTLMNCSLLTTSAQNSEDAPNIILILADDMGYADCGVHGCNDIKTPNIDLIARNGVHFKSAYSNGSFCTPTRVALMSGRYQQRSGNDDLPGITGPLPKAVNTLADRLSSAGYTTGLIGKWHLGGKEGFLPLDRGFDEFFGFHGGGRTYFPEKIDPKGKSRGYSSPIYRQDEPVKETRYLTDAFGQESAAFLKRHRDSKKPVFLSLSFNAVHTPMEASNKYLSRFPNLVGKRKTYAAMLSAMDDAIGLVLEELEASGKAEHTMIIFANDNGGPITRNAINGSLNSPLRGSKGETFEGGIRVPLFARWPGKIQPGTTYDKSVMTFDISATILQAAGADTSQIDGTDLIPYLSGEKNGDPHELLFWRSRTRNNNLAARRGNWKYVSSTEGTEHPGPEQTPARDMLFNLADDLGEQNDLSAKHPNILKDLKRLYATWDKAVDADCRELGIDPPAVRKIKRK